MKPKLSEVMAAYAAEVMRSSRLEAELAAATAPARFRRITKRTKVTAPCVMIYAPSTPTIITIYRETEMANIMKSGYTHWLPIQWPEVRG